MSMDDILKRMNSQQRARAASGLMEKLDSLKVRYEGSNDKEDRQKILELYRGKFVVLAELTHYRKMLDYSKWYCAMKRGGG